MRAQRRASTIELEDGDDARAATSSSSRVGRSPTRDDLGLETVGLEPGAGTSRSTTSCASPAATGSTRSATSTAASLLTHMGKYQARIAADVILGREAGRAARSDGAAVAAGDLHRPAGRGRRPHARRRAREAGLNVARRRRRDVGATPAAASTAATRPAPRGSSSTRTARVIVGATFTGADVAELLHAATIAVVGEVPLDAPLARGAVLPDAQRGLAAPARELRPLSRQDDGVPAASTRLAYERAARPPGRPVRWSPARLVANRSGIGV